VRYPGGAGPFKRARAVFYIRARRETPRRLYPSGFEYSMLWRSNLILNSAAKLRFT
jgi:hypothetical protein